MKIASIFILLALAQTGFAQTGLYKAGDRLPDLTIKHIINAPVKEVAVNDLKEGKILILNFWGTWCSPCIPEMDKLAKLQKANERRIQVIGLSNDPRERLQKYLVTKPSTLWLATDTTSFLYKLFGFASVGHSAIIGSNKKIVALVKTDSIDQRMIDRLVKGMPVTSNANLAEPLLNTGADAFGVDSLTSESFTFRGYMNGKPGMSMEPPTGPYAHRRISYYNTCASEMYRRAYDIHSPKQMIYEVDRKILCDYDNRQSLYCLDILVKPADKDSLRVMLQKRLQQELPFKVKVEYRMMPVYVLKQKEGVPLNLPVSTATVSSYGYNGNGYKGTGVSVTEFAHDYLTNELELPVVDETGLTARYDIKTVNELRTAANTIAAVEKLGLKLEKSERMVKTLVIGK